MWDKFCEFQWMLSVQSVWLFPSYMLLYAVHVLIDCFLCLSPLPFLFSLSLPPAVSGADVERMALCRLDKCFTTKFRGHSHLSSNFSLGGLLWFSLSICFQPETNKIESINIFSLTFPPLLPTHKPLIEQLDIHSPGPLCAWRTGFGILCRHQNLWILKFFFCFFLRVYYLTITSWMIAKICFIFKIMK